MVEVRKIEEATEKRCRACGETKPLDAYSLASAAADGRNGVCKQCDSARLKRQNAEKRAGTYQKKTRGKAAIVAVVPNGVKPVVTDKPCSTCKRVKPLSEFYFNRTTADGRHHECKDCKQVRDTAFREQMRAEGRQAIKHDAPLLAGPFTPIMPAPAVTPLCISTEDTNGISFYFLSDMAMALYDKARSTFCITMKTTQLNATTLNNDPIEVEYEGQQATDLLDALSAVTGRATGDTAALRRELADLRSQVADIERLKDEIGIMTMARDIAHAERDAAMTLAEQAEAARNKAEARLAEVRRVFNGEG